MVKDEDDDELKEVEVSEDGDIYKLTAPNIQKYWLKMEPAAQDYIQVVIRTFARGLEEIKRFERWSKHHDLAPYADALEEWDDVVGGKWTEPESLKLDPYTWIQDNVLYRQQQEIVEKILVSAFSKTTLFLKRFQPLLEIYWRNKKVDLNILVNEQLKGPIKALENTINLFNYQHELFDAKLPAAAGIGLIQLDS